MTTTKRSTKASEKKQAAMAARWRMIAEIAEQMDAAMQMDEAEAEAVAVMADQTGYSERNAALIIGQCPQARQVHSFKAWKEQHGRQVRKGEKAIYVLAPASKRKGEDTADGGETAAPSAAEAAKEAAEQAESEDKPKRSRFVLVPVFDVSQTDPVETQDAAEDAA